jgi:hypothetical protein
MLLMLSATAELTGAAKKMTEADIRSTVKLGNTLTERPDVLAAADPSMFIDGVCAAPGNGVPASTSASDGDGAAVTGANAGARASSCEQFRARLASDERPSIWPCPGVTTRPRSRLAFTCPD